MHRLQVLRYQTMTSSAMASFARVVGNMVRSLVNSQYRTKAVGRKPVFTLALINSCWTILKYC